MLFYIFVKLNHLRAQIHENREIDRQIDKK